MAGHVLGGNLPARDETIFRNAEFKPVIGHPDGVYLDDEMPDTSCSLHASGGVKIGTKPEEAVFLR
jgi:hypothetical protein